MDVNNNQYDFISVTIKQNVKVLVTDNLVNQGCLVT
jgi:hypothetical protein